MSDEIFAKFDFQALSQDTKKSSRRQLQITDAAIDLIFENGLEGLTYEALSKKCGIARSLIYHYFPTPTELLLFSAGLIRFRYQSFVLEQMSTQSNVMELLKTYIQYALLWVDRFPREACVWLIFFHRCAVSPMLAEHNKSLVDMGVKRIAGLLLRGIDEKELGIQKEDAAQVARQIQLLITGGLVSRATEHRPIEFWNEEFENILRLSLILVLPLQS